jgi:hypothetical protein
MKRASKNIYTQDNDFNASSIWRKSHNYKQMKKTYLFITAVSLLLITNINLAQQKDFGLGVILGEPTGISAKFWLSPGTALDFGLGYSFTSSNSVFDLYADYVFHDSHLIRSTENFIVYYGPGARLKIKEDADSRLGVRGVIGILWIPHGSSFDLFVEIAPILDIIPATKFDFSGGIGGRYFFN